MICGVDEAGRGPVLGPLVICAVGVDDERELAKLGVKDSKKLTPAKRMLLDPQIRKLARVELVEVSAEELDSLMKDMSLNEIEAMKFAELVERLSPDVAYIDAADVSEENFARMVMACLKCEPKIVSEHKADVNYPVVSAASIVAKVRRDARIREIEAELGEPIGSGYASDENTISFIQDYTKKNGTLPPHTRKSWLTAKNIMSLKDVRALESFEG